MDPSENEDLEKTNPEGQEPEPQEPQAPAQPEQPEGGEEGGEPEAPSQEDPEEPDDTVSTGSARLDKRVEKFAMKLRNEFATRSQQRPQPDKPYQPVNLDDMEYDPETLQLLKQDRERIAKDAYSQGAGERQALVQERFMDRFEVDADRVTAKYPTMDETSEDFDPDLAAGINEQYLALVGYEQRPDGSAVFHNPIIRYRDYVDSQMALIERAATSRNADTAQNVAKQASRTGPRPSGGAKRGAVDLSPIGIRKMTPEEYEKNRPAIEAEIRRSMGL
jgi:hypothetical protein